MQFPEALCANACTDACLVAPAGMLCRRASSLPPYRCSCLRTSTSSLQTMTSRCALSLLYVGMATCRMLVDQHAHCGLGKHLPDSH